jgi:O-methyltransferase
MAHGGEIVRRLRATAQLRLARRGVVLELHRRGTPEHFTFVEGSGRHYPVDFEPEWIETIERVFSFTLTTPERIAALCAATEYAVRHEIPGSFVECGVWRGGSMMAVALTLLRLGVGDRDLYLFDTYSGMTRPSEADVDYSGYRALDDWPSPEEESRVGAVPLAEVEAALGSTGYNRSRLHFVVGDVKKTLPVQAPFPIAVLRLDTDWYDSTFHELTHLYPNLVPGGVIIIDDYGHLVGARRAVDEYFVEEPIFLSRLDYSGRLGIKQRQR